MMSAVHSGAVTVKPGTLIVSKQHSLMRSSNDDYIDDDIRMKQISHRQPRSIKMPLQTDVSKK